MQSARLALVSGIIPVISCQLSGKETFTYVFIPYIHVKHVKGTNGRQKTYEIFHVHCVFYSGFMRQTTIIFGITKDGSLVLTTLAS